MRLRSDLVLRQVVNEYMIVDPGQGMIDLSKVYTLNETATVLWKRLQNRDFTESDVVEVLLDYYDVPVSTARADAQRLIKSFFEEGLLID